MELYVITAIFNPAQYLSRYVLYEKFARRCKTQGIILYTVETVFEGQSYKVTKPNTIGNIQLKATSMLWHKESMINIAIESLPKEAEYIAWLDADILFTNPDIVEDTINSLQKYDIVQMFGTTIDINSVHEIENTEKPKLSFFKDVIDQGWPHNETEIILGGHTGYAWAARRDCIVKLGGLIDFCILGTADTHMSHSLIGIESDFYNPLLPSYYKESISKFYRICNTNRFGIGYVNGSIIHYYHGKKSNRLYDIRDDILVKEEFNPYEDIVKEDSGLYRFTGKKPNLESYVSNYFFSRMEDDGITNSFFWGI